VVRIQGVRRLVLPLLILISRVVFAQALSPEVALTSGAVAASPEDSRRPRIVRNGGNQLVAWDAYDRTRWLVLDSNKNVVNRGVREGLYFRDAIAAGDGFFILCAGYPDNKVVMLDRDGAVRNEVIVPNSTDQAMAWNGSRVLVAGFQRETYLLDPNTNAYSGPITLPEIESSTFIYSMAATAAEFGVVLSGPGTIHLARVSPQGTLLGVVDLGPALQGPASYDRPSIATDGASFFVAWRLNDSLRGAIVTNGVVAQSFTIADHGVTGFPHAAWNGTDYAIVYEMSADVFENRVSAAGTVSARETIAATARVERYPDVAGSTVVFERDPQCSQSETSIVASIGGHETLLSTGVPSEVAPAVAGTKDAFFAAYLERSDAMRIRTTFGDFPVDDVSQWMPAVATDGEGFLVVAIDSCGIVRAARFTSAGPGAAIEIGRGAQSGARPFVMWNGSEFVALWEDQNSYQVMAAPLDRDGRPLNGPRGLTPAIENNYFVSVASYSFTLVPNGGEYLLLWENYRFSDIPLYTDPPPIYEVRVRHISASLHAIGDSRVIATGQWPYAASNGTDAVLTWSWDGKVHAGRLTANGDLASDQVIGGYGYFAPVTQVISAGNEFVVADGPLVARLDRNGAPVWYADVPADDTAVAWNGTTVKLLYSRGERVYERDVINPLPRRRGVIH
jgi:hypothetical protein